MGVVFFAAGALFGAAQHLLARKMFNIGSKPGRSAIYIGQLLILSMGLLLAMYFISQTALLAAAAGLVIASIVLAVVFNLKR
jgi:hypothetical protein